MTNVAYLQKGGEIFWVVNISACFISHLITLQMQSLYSKILCSGSHFRLLGSRLSAEIPDCSSVAVWGLPLSLSRFLPNLLAQNEKRELYSERAG
jgi:hypothetical protein